MALLSRFLTYEAAVASDTAKKYGIKNVPGSAELSALVEVGGKIYDKVVDHFGGLVFVSSGFRSPILNARVGGSSTSGHKKGEALDIDGDAPSGSYVKVDNNVLFHWIKDNCTFDQLIAEFVGDGAPKWVHASYRKNGNRGLILIATKNSRGETQYLTYTDKLYRQIFYKYRPKGIDLGDMEFEVPDIVRCEESMDFEMHSQIPTNTHKSEPELEEWYANKNSTLGWEPIGVAGQSEFDNPEFAVLGLNGISTTNTPPKETQNKLPENGELVSISGNETTQTMDLPGVGRVSFKVTVTISPIPAE